MTTTDSFNATILFAVLAIALLGVASIVLANDLALVGTVFVACMTYLTQSAATLAMTYTDLAERAGVDVMSATARLAMRWQKLALMLWLATLTVGAAVVAVLVVGYVR
jgi:hypothetical protein